MWHKRMGAASIAALILTGGTLLAAGGGSGGALVWARARQQQGPGTDISRGVLTDAEAFLLAPAEMIAGGQIQSVVPSPDGRYVLVTRVRHELPAGGTTIGNVAQAEAPPPETSLILWDSRTRKTSVVWKGAGGPPAAVATSVIDQVTWMPGTQNALVLLRTRQANADTDTRAASSDAHRLLLVNAPGASFRTVAPQPGTTLEGSSVAVSQTHPVAVFSTMTVQNGQGVDLLRAVRSDGTLGPAVRVPERTFLEGFSRDGKQVYFFTMGAYDRETKKRAPTTYSALNLTGTIAAITPLDKKPQVVAPQDSGENEPGNVAANPAGADIGPPLRLAGTSGVLTRAGTRQNVRPIWLERADLPASAAPASPAPAATANSSTAAEPPQSRALVTPDCDDVPLTRGQEIFHARSRYPEGAGRVPVPPATGALLLPDASAVLYRAGGALYAVPILRLDKAAFLEARRQALRTVALSNARQLGVGIMMYTQDYDEVLPGGDSINDKITPYVKNDALFAGFVYTFAGGPLAKIDRPADTIIGYVTGPGGRANLYADGHAKWRDD